MLKQLLSITTLALLPLAANAGTVTQIIPAAGTGPGLNNSNWETELVIHNGSSRGLDLNLVYHDASGSSTQKPFFVGPRTTSTAADVVRTVFSVGAGTGAIEVNYDDSFAGRIAVTSRTFNVAADGSKVGQDVPAVDAATAPGVGDVIVLAGPEFAAQFRLNFGLYAVSDTDVNWELIRTDGTIAASKEITYSGGTQVQYNNGIVTLLNATAQDGDVIYANVNKGQAIAYASAINGQSGDPTYVPGLTTKSDSHVAFGVDLNGDGIADITDANGDGVLDQPIDLFTMGYPNYFRIVVQGDGAQNATFALVDSPRDALLLDNGTVEWAPGSDVRGTSQSLRIKVTINGVSDIITIPGNVK